MSKMASDVMLSSPILVIEDTELNLQLILNILHKRGFTDVMSARDGIEALDRINECAPDLIILDVMMPRMDGFVLCKYLRALDAYQHVPVLVLAPTEQDYAKMVSLGATDFIAKPIIPRMFLNQVEENLLSYHRTLRIEQPSRALENG